MLVVKNLPANANYMRGFPGWGRSPGGGHGHHCSILAWRIPWREELGRLWFVGLQESDTTEDTEHQKFKNLNLSQSFFNDFLEV